jgi:isoleucyl-tRNA synthetase
MLVLSVALFDKAAYQNVIVNGTVLNDVGQKMSKSKKNFSDPMDVVDLYSADALRYYLLASPLMKAEEMIRLLSEIAPTFLIIGNHDRPNNSVFLTNEHTFNSMKQWENTYVVDKVTDITLKDKRFIFVSY